MTDLEIAAMLQGAVDMHVHSSPDVQPRKMSDAALATAAKRMGLAGLLIKCHHSPTAGRAAAVRECITGLKVFGGIVLNRMAGGLNAMAAETEMALGAKEVWLPTVSAVNHIRYYHGDLRWAVPVTTENGQLCSELYDIFDLVASHETILATGHLAPEESRQVVKEARAHGVKKILVTHPEWEAVAMPVALQQELAREGAFFERCFFACNSPQHLPPQEVVRQIKAVGSATTILSSDFGQVYNVPPPEGLRQFVQAILAGGITAREVEVMIKDNPWAFLGEGPD